MRTWPCISHLQAALYLKVNVKMMHRLQLVQKVAVHLLHDSSPHEHIRPLLKSFHWLPVSMWWPCKALVLISKAINIFQRRSGEPSLTIFGKHCKALLFEGKWCHHKWHSHFEHAFYSTILRAFLKQKSYSKQSSDPIQWEVADCMKSPRDFATWKVFRHSNNGQQYKPLT